MKVFAPDSVNVPVPCLTSPPLPEITPAKLVSVASPVVSVLAPSVTVEVPEADASEPMVSDPVNVRSPVPFSVTAAVSDSAAPSAVSPAAVFTVTTPESMLPVTVRRPPPTVVAPV